MRAYVVGVVLRFYWWLREYPTVKTPADLRLESRLWEFAGDRDLARLLRSEAEQSHVRAVGAADALDVIGLAFVCALVAVTVAVLAAQVLRWAA